MLSILYICIVIQKSKFMKLLLPNRFKKYGLFMAPLGFAFWLAMQYGFIKRLLILLFNDGSSFVHSINVLVAILSFFSFLAGIYFLVFSKEKIEDEMIQKTRLDSFQFAALVQIVFMILGFLWMSVFKEPNEGGMMLFFISLIFIFWLSFIGRFNCIIHIRIKLLNEKHFEA